MKSASRAGMPRAIHALGLAGLIAVVAIGPGHGPWAAGVVNADLAPLPEVKPVNRDMAELGRYLFFDNRISGDWGTSCASCHDPEKGWADGAPLSRGYTSVEYFRNAPTLLNVKYRARFTWDGRLDGSDLGTLVRDMVTEAHFMNADGRIVQERLKQVPEYVAMWEKIFGKGADPYGPRMFNVIAEYVKTIESKNAPIDRLLKGDAAALSAPAQQGYALFRGKAGCIACHNGPLASDGQLHRLGVSENPVIAKEPLRMITMLRHYATLGMPNYMNVRTDVGAFAVTKDTHDTGKFVTPSLRDLKYTAPYMHNGVFTTLDEVVEFYAKGGGAGAEVKPLALSAEEKKALVAFLLALSGDPVIAKAPDLPEMQPRTFGKN